MEQMGIVGIRLLAAAAAFVLGASVALASDDGDHSEASQFQTLTANDGLVYQFRSGRLRPPRPAPEQSTCAGIRGNGANLFAHYGVLARQVEEYGAVTCAAGGSSGSITAFVLESIWANPDTHLCANRRLCGRRGRDARMALLLKSFIGLSEAGLFEDVNVIVTLLQEVSDNSMLERMRSPDFDESREALEAFIRVLQDLGPLINKEAIELLLTSPDPIFHATDIIEGLQEGVQFVVSNPRVFLRTSVLDFEEVANLFGLYGSFYAGYGPADRPAMRRWMRACARPSIGLTWRETATLPGTLGRSCGEELVDLFNEYRLNFAEFDGRSRVDDRIGRFLPVFGVTGVITGESVAIWEEARAAWLAATPIPFEPNFEDIGVGYWGRRGELNRIAERLQSGRRFNDLGSMQFTPLNRATWREILAASPAEPGFSPAVPLATGALSVGGWADPLRVLSLEALGARATIAVNRRDGVGGFTVDITRLLNATEQDIDALYSTTDSASTFSRGLRRASGVWCTDWDGQMGDPNLLFDDAYSSPLITDRRRFLRPRFGYENVGPEFVIDGCNPAY